ncbi:MAG: hypothetical protein GF401_02400 [Chitinivibrionales bacterium]|nr:hypothetical protein [Chitinivibrionales bacterium]
MSGLSIIFHAGSDQIKKECRFFRGKGFVVDIIYNELITINERGHTTERTYNSFGQVLTETDPLAM